VIESPSLLQHILRFGPAEFWPLLGYVITVAIILIRRVAIRLPVSVLDVQLLLGAGILIFLSLAATITTMFYISVAPGVDNDYALHSRMDSLQTLILGIGLSVLLLLVSHAIPAKK